MSSPPTAPWQDRRGMFQRGKEVHEPARRPSGGVIDAVRKASVSSIDAIEKTVTGGSVNSGAPGSPPAASQRRRSSAASGGLFNNLSTMKRGSEDYGERRASHAEQAGYASGWFNTTFRGIAKDPKLPSGTGAQKESRKGVME